MNSKIFNISLFCLLLLLYFISYSLLLSEKSNQYLLNKKENSWIENISPRFLVALSGEFKGIIASYLTLEAGAQLGTSVVRLESGEYATQKRQRNWNQIHKIFTLSQSLDPAFEQTFQIAQGWLPWDADMISETQAILKIAASNRLNDWQPIHYQAFNQYYFLKKPGEAGKTMLLAAKRKNAPSFLSILGARLAQQGNETEAAINLMKSMLATKEKSEPGYIDIIDRLHALEGVLVLETSIDHFQSKHNRLPNSVDELLSSGFLDKVPENPYDLPYCIDSKGNISFDAPKCL